MRPNGIRERLLRELQTRSSGSGQNRLQVRQQLETAEIRRLRSRQIRAFLDQGTILEPLPSHVERLARLRDKSYFGTSDFEAQQWLCADELAETPELREFVRRFVLIAAEYEVPVYCRTVFGPAVDIWHCQWQDRLSDEDWLIFSQFGYSAARKAGLRFEWGGPRRPAQWQFLDG